MAGVLSLVARRPSQKQIRHVTPVPPAAAQGVVAEVYAQVEREFGMLAPPVSLHSPAPGPLAAAWLMLRETLLVDQYAARADKEAVAAAVSLGNQCPYCVEVHSATLHGLVRGQDAAAIADGRLDSVADPHIRELAEWARESRRPEPPAPAEQIPELVGVAVAFHYLNRMVNVFLDESVFPAGLPATARGWLMPVIGRTMRPITRRPKEPGAALDLLPPAPLPEDLSWAAGTPTVAGSFARAAAAIDEAGTRTVPPAVRDLVMTKLVSWRGESPGLGRGWADEAVSGLPAEERPAGRLALLTALASYQVVESDIAQFRLAHSGDVALVELTSWASLTAARRALSPTAINQGGARE